MIINECRKKEWSSLEESLKWEPDTRVGETGWYEYAAGNIYICGGQYLW
jgi:hypothetical protein